ncbi:hypothetical protein H9L10_03515 [Phycicoccus endophyticus]|uniref:Phage tail tape measure protein domain-containing protein n=1 Tax=Phycicoccus endophyticus TaxID=1690220 RepID=A0A7G9R3G2_9MICO|nr:hypothetical protein [Phycicoccus endophyticus]NHI19893.1 hypothetical protein [Phycicoccus endophyticus]QNN50137.1 hypothetical protein H9L10_03515 [Phycicoccus endophyticus]GGL27719.1 hypothetical protein GCM10012283_07400 [Phycicoccus endophyticus]
MADRTVRAIFEARVSGARKGMTDLSHDVDQAGQKVDDLTKDLKTLDAQKAAPEIDVEIDEAKKRLSDLTRELGDLKKEPSSPEVDLKIEQAKANIVEVRREIKDLTQAKTEVRIDAGIKDAKKAIASITNELGLLRTLDVTPEVSADIRDAQKRLREARASLRELNAAKAEVTVTADTTKAENAVDDLAGDIATKGDEAGDAAGENVVSGILGALATIPIAGAVIGAGAAIAAGLVAGIRQGLSIEAERDLFSARTGLDEATSARFGRSAGEAYANAYGDSVEGNLDAARRALAGGLIDEDATSAEIENVIAKLTGLQDLFDYDIPMSVQAVGNAMKTGLVRDADQAFDLITAASQKLPSDDLLDTVNEYSNQFVTLGLNGDQAFGLIVQGAQAGARDTDKVADALKELGLRVREGTDPAIQALELLGLNAQETIAAFQKGGPEAATAIGDVFDALREAKKEGKNVQSAIANLFGGPGEDLGAALFSLNLGKVESALGGVNGSAGAADRALSTMADNTATKIESARRNVEIAMDGIKGALAEAFGDEISGAADWVSRNRAPLMQFFLDVINGTIDMAEGFADFSASALDGIASVAASLSGLLDILPGTDGIVDPLRDLAASAREGADTLRTEVPEALEVTRDKINTWAGPELLKARVHDATMAMTADMDAFSAAVDESGGTVTINGDKKNADQALKLIVKNINGEDGTVTINGDRVPAESALDRVIHLIRNSKGDVTIGGDSSKARATVDGLRYKIDRTSGRVTVTANATAAEHELNYTARDRTSTIRVNYAYSSGGSVYRSQVPGYHGGGRLTGRYAGGWVPGSDPGYDNVLWPLNSGGRTLSQPLAGKEFVVNSRQAEPWGPFLEWINAGGMPSAGSAALSEGIDYERLGRAVAAAMSGVRLAVGVDEVGHAVQLHDRKKRR